MNKLMDFLTYGFNLGIGIMSAIGGVIVGIIVLVFIGYSFLKILDWNDRRKRRNNKLP